MGPSEHFTRVQSVLASLFLSSLGYSLTISRGSHEDQGALARAGPGIRTCSPLVSVVPNHPRGYLLLSCCAHGCAGIQGHRPGQGPTGSTALQLGSSFMINVLIAGPFPDPAFALPFGPLLSWFLPCSSQSGLTCWASAAPPNSPRVAEREPLPPLLQLQLNSTQTLPGRMNYKAWKKCPRAHACVGPQ